MVSILINWFYICLTTFITGHFVTSKLYQMMKGKHHVSVMTSLVAGIAVNTTYAGFYSLFGGVNIAANVVLLILCAVCVFLERDYYKELTQRVKMIKNQKITVSKLIMVLLALIIIAGISYFCSNTGFMYDTGLYHAQSIRWTEEYGAVKGIANIHERFGYNSSFFSFMALYSMKDLFGQSLHSGQAFIGAIVCIYAVCGLFTHWSRKYLFSNVCRVAPVIYTIIILFEIISPTTDFPTVYLIMWLVIRFALLAENGETDSAPYALLAVFTVFLVALKLTAVCMVLIVIYPAYDMIRHKKWKQVMICVAAGLILIAPYLIRNVIISGWLVYPFASLDLFLVDWKLPAETAIGDATDIKVYARYVYDRSLVSQSIFQWFPTWWEGQRPLERFFSAAALLAAPAGLIVCAIRLLMARKVVDTKLFQIVLLNIVMICGFAFWMFSSPLHRYGYAFLLTVPLLVIATTLDMFWDYKWLRVFGLICSAGLFALIAFPTYKTLWDDYYLFKDVSKDTSYLFMQKDYPDPEMESQDLNGITIYYPQEAGGQSWYAHFPATNFGTNIQYWENRGDHIQDGFRHKY
ncbi:MAG: hypothetical protein GX567_18835 [Clostridia bacterium]|nr:hypothetical protein [Clostridia bacterium]